MKISWNYQKKTKGTFLGLWNGQGYFDKIPNAQETKATINKWDFIKLKSSSAIKERTE